MKKILYVSDLVDMGGGETSLLNLIIQVKKEGKFEPYLLTPSYGKLNQEAEKNGIKTFNFPFSFILNRGWIKFIPIINPIAVFKLIKLLKREKIEIIHSNSFHKALTNSLIASKVCNVKLFWTCHMWYECNKIRDKFLNFFVKKVFIVSKSVADCSSFPESKKIIYTIGIDSSKITNKTEQQKYKIREELNLPQDNILVAVIGRYSPFKQQLFFVRAINEWLDENKEYISKVKFLLIGEAFFGYKSCIYKQKVKDFIAQCKFKDSFICLPFQDDMDSVYNILDIVAITSTRESFSMVTLEAAFHQKAMLVTNGGAPKEIVANYDGAVLFETFYRDETDRTQLTDSTENIKLTFSEVLKMNFNEKRDISSLMQWDIKNICKKITQEY